MNEEILSPNIGRSQNRSHGESGDGVGTKIVEIPSVIFAPKKILAYYDSHVMEFSNIKNFFLWKNNK